MVNKIMPFRILCKLATPVGVTVALLMPFESIAALWKLTPSVTLEGRYEDNIRLRSGPHEEVTGTLLKGTALFSRRTENSEVSGRLRLNFSDYSGDPEVSDNKDSQFFTFASKYNTERTKWGLVGTYRRDTTLKSVDLSLDSEDPVDDPVADDTDEGLVDVDVRRQVLRLIPSWQHDLSERMIVNLTLNVTDVTYDDNPAGSGLFDFDQQRVSAGLFRRLTERDTINITAGAARFNSPDNADNEVESYDLTVGYRRKFSEITDGSIDVGVNHSSQTSTVQSSDNDGFVLRLRMDHKTELNRYRFEITHDLLPSGSGSINEASQVRFRFNRKLSERLVGRLNARYIEKKSRESLNPRTEYFYTIEPRLSWQLTRWWTLAGGYSYRDNRNADSNMVFLSLSHRKPITLD